MFQLLLVDKKVSEVKEVLSLSGALIEHYKGSPTQKESLNVFFLVLQVCHYLMAGQVSTYPIIVTQHFEDSFLCGVYLIY